jgi:hypothetical protein
MTDLETAILVLLSHRKGRLMALRAKTIAEMLSTEADGPVSEREVREAIKALIEQHHHPIASTVEKPYGFFVPATPEEVEAYAAQLKGRIISTATRLRAFEQSTADKVIDAVGQGRLAI